MFMKPEGLLVYIKLSNVFHHSIQPKNVISIFIFTFNIINQAPIFDFHITRLVLQIHVFQIKSDIPKVSEQPNYQLSTLNAMAICDQRHANVSKQTT